MAYDPFLRRRRTINDPLVPIPNFIPPYGSGATVGELDSAVKQESDFNKALYSPGGLSPYYGSRSYTQEAQASKPAVAPIWGVRPTGARTTTHYPSMDEASAILAKYGTSGAGTPPTARPASREWTDPMAAFTPTQPAAGGVNYMGSIIGATNYMGTPISSGSASSSPATAAPAQNAIQRWQGTALDQRPPVPPAFTAGQRRFIQTGRIGGHALPSPNERMPGGFTPQLQWDQMFTPQIEIPKARRPVSGYAWE